MKQVITLLKTNRFAQIALGATVGILILVLLLSPKHVVNPPSPTRLPPSSPRPELEQVDNETKQSAVTYRTSVADVLPITYKGYATSVGLDTTIYLYILPEDPTSTVRFEIFGLSYLNPDTDPVANPNVVAFKESYLKGLELLRAQGLKPENMIFLHSDIDYIRVRTQAWLKALDLLPSP